MNSIDICSRLSHSLFLRDGLVWAWGSNGSGQLGNGESGEYVIYTMPQRVRDISDIIMIDAGFDYSMALDAQGEVWIWGDSQFLVPKKLPLSNVKAIAAGGNHKLALKNDGTLWAWGDNFMGQLGDGTTIPRASPVRVLCPENVIAVAAGGEFSLAMCEDGAAWAWGSRQFQQLGDGTGSLPDTSSWAQSLPVRVMNLENVVQIAVGEEHCFAIAQDGAIWAWGSNEAGQLGNGLYDGPCILSVALPIQIAFPGNIVSLVGGSDHTLAIDTEGAVWAWGSHAEGQLGTDTDGTLVTYPQKIPGLHNIIAISAGDHCSLAVKRDGTIWAWGKNNQGQLGDGTTQNRTVPTQVIEL